MRACRRMFVVLMVLTAALAAREAGAQSNRYGTAGLNRRYSAYQPSSRAVYDYREPASYAPSRRSWDPYTPYYSRPAVWPYYPRYYGSWFYGPYSYRYGFAPWFGGYGPYSMYGPFRWPNAWRLAEVGPVPWDRLDYAGRIPMAPFDPRALVSPVDVGRGIPAAPAAVAAGECYYW